MAGTVLLSLALSLAGLRGMAQAPAGTVGPDPVPVDLTEFVQVGRAGSEAAFSMRTVICNQGDAAMDWHRNPDPRHPFLVFNVYRIKDDRIEQIGRSWVKHGYSASQGGGCGGRCLSESGNQHLGIGCSDVYSVGSNGRQSTYGPRSEIDPWTGEFTFDGSHLDVTNTDIHDRIEHRLRIEDRDLHPDGNAGARYLVELYVLAHDDIDHENSIGYKEFSVVGSSRGTWELELQQTFASSGSALWDWFGGVFTIFPEGEPEDDGRAYLKTKVTDNGDGTWHYEYALFNLDMTRAIGELRVPVAADVDVTNLGFFAPRSFDEAYDNEPWEITREGGELIWATTPFAEDPTPNPLRWGTLYNFRFDANVPPADSTVSIGAFRPGGTTVYPGEAKAPSMPPGPAAMFKRADSDASGVVELNDAIITASYLFLGNARPPCLDALDANDSGDLDLSDVIAPLGWLFNGGTPPPAPGPWECGLDLTPADPPFDDCAYDPQSC